MGWSGVGACAAAGAGRTQVGVRSISASTLTLSPGVALSVLGSSFSRVDRPGFCQAHSNRSALIWFGKP